MDFSLHFDGFFCQQLAIVCVEVNAAESYIMWPQCDHKRQGRAEPILVKLGTFNRFQRAIRTNNWSAKTAIGNAKVQTLRK